MGLLFFVWDGVGTQFLRVEKMVEVLGEGEGEEGRFAMVVVSTNRGFSQCD
jgi:hypothetical protein